MIFWPDDSADAPKQASSASGGADQIGAATNNRGGVPARQADEARSGQGEGGQPVVNPHIRPSTQFGMSNNPPSSEPPEFSDESEELAYWELQLSEAERVLAMREKAIGRIPKMKERMAASKDPEGSLAQFDRRVQVIHENLALQREKVAELQEKVGALRAGG